MQVMTLNRLDRGALQALVGAMVGTENVSEELLETLEAETEGNVYFLVEVVHGSAESAGQLDRVSGARLP